MALRDQPYFPLYVQDFLTDEKLIECSAQSTGVYIRLLCIMHKSDEYGKILLRQKDKQNDKQILNFAYKLAKQMPYSEKVVADSLTELISEKVLFIEGDYLCQKRMIKDNSLSVIRSKAGKIGGDFARAKVQAKPQAKHQANIIAKHQANTEYEIEYEYEYENDNKNEIEIEKKEKLKIEIINPFGESGFELWEAWKEYKKSEHRQSYKNVKTEQTALNNLYEMAGGNIEVAKEIVNQSISNQWKGLFTNKNKINESNKSYSERFGKKSAGFGLYTDILKKLNDSGSANH